MPNSAPPASPVLAVELAPDATRALLRVPGNSADLSFMLPDEDRLAGPSGPDSPAFWNGLCALAGLPRPGRVLVCADTPHGPDSQGPPLLHRLIEEADPGGLPVDALARPCSFSGLLRLCAIQRMTGTAAADISTAFALGLLSQPGLRSRAFRQGMTLLYLDGQRIFAALLFRDAFHAFCELALPEPGSVDPIGMAAGSGASGDPASAPDMPHILKLLEDFRLGWLPAEQAEAQGGRVCRVPQLPAEAEGFKPLIAAGPGAALLKGRARVVEDGNGTLACRGLLYGWSEFAAQAV